MGFFINDFIMLKNFPSIPKPLRGFFVVVLFCFNQGRMLNFVTGFFWVSYDLVVFAFPSVNGGIRLIGLHAWNQLFMPGR